MQLGLSSVPVALADNLTATQIKAFRLLANESASWAEWDIPLLQAELISLEKLDFDLKLTGFDDVKLATYGIGNGSPQSDPDDEPAPKPSKTKTTIFLTVANKHAAKAKIATAKALDAAGIDHNL